MTLRFMAMMLLSLFLLQPLQAEEVSYEAALEAFRADRLKESGRMLKQILKKDPNNKQAAMLVGAIYYQYQSQKLAYRYFEESDDGELSKETAFAWGATYLAENEFKKAALGFRYVLKHKGQSRAYARYYLGVCYYELGQMARARRHFEKTKSEKLPVSMRLKRARYIKEIRALQENLAIAFVGPGDATLQDSGSRDFTEEGEDSAYASDDAVRVQFRPSLSLTQYSNSANNNDLARDESDVLAHRAVLAWRYGKGPGGSSFGSMDLGLGIAGYQATSNQTQQVSLAGSTGVFINQKESEQSENSAYVQARPRLSFSLGPIASAESGFSYTAYLPESKTDKAWGQSEALIGLAMESNAVSINVDASLQQPFDESLHEKANDTLIKAGANVDLGDVGIRIGTFQWTTDDVNFLSPDRFRYSFADSSLRYRLGFKSEVGLDAALSYGIEEASLSLKLENRKRTTANGESLTRRSSLDPIDLTAAEVQKLIVAANIPLWDNLTLVLSGARNSLSGYRFISINANDPSLTKDFNTGVEQTVYAAGAIISLADWIRVNGTYAYGFNRYQDSATLDPDFLRSNPDLLEDSSIALELSKSF